MIVNTTCRDAGVAEQRARLADACPLYIAPGADTQVDLDGPALCIVREERAEQLFPLRRVSRVYSGDDTRWTSEALLACAALGIGVLFVDDRGEVVARMLGRPGVYDSLYHRLEEFLLLPQAMGMYRHWHRTFARRTAWWAGARLKIPRVDRTPSGCRRTINAMARRYVGEQGEERTRQWLRAIAYSWMQSHLLDLGFGNESELTQSGEPALARDLTELFVWYLDPARVGWLRRRWLAAQRKGEPVREPTHADLVRLFESRSARAAARGREITGSLHRWLIHET